MATSSPGTVRGPLAVSLPPSPTTVATMALGASMDDGELYEEPEPGERESLMGWEDQHHDHHMEPDTRTVEFLALSLNQMSTVQRPAVPATPAPLATPPQGDPSLPRSRRPPVVASDASRSAMARSLNSTFGRASIIVCALVLFNYLCYGFAIWKTPSFRLDHTAPVHLGIAVLLFFLMYSLPLLAERAGMSARDTGWKPYFVSYRLAYLLALPAIVLHSLGNGGALQHGLKDSSAGIQGLRGNFWDYFETVDGFVALNLTKGIVETVEAEEHGETSSRRQSRFQEYDLRLNVTATDAPEPTEPPGMLTTYIVAPIFINWALCATQYRVSSTCLQEEDTVSVAAWALQRTESVCTNLGIMACHAPTPLLEPVYRCSSEGGGVQGRSHTEPVEGLCGRVTRRLPEGALDELRTLLLEDGWPRATLPDQETIWLDVRPDSCISDTDSCEATWQLLWIIGIALQILTDLLLLLPMWLDCVFDYRIREARLYLEQSRKARQQMEMMKV